MEAPLNLSAKRVIRVAKPSITDLERRYVNECLDDCQLSAGPRNAVFEQKFAEAHGRKFGVTCNSGTTALMLALKALGVGQGSRVAMPTMTMVACPNAALALGAEPVFFDSEPETGNSTLGPCSADAYMAVHLYGVPCQLPPVAAEKIIEDCSEAHGARYLDGSPVGSRSALATFSFYANKIIQCAEGGIVLTDDEKVSERLKSLRAHAFTPSEHFHHTEMAYGVRMSELHAAIGLAQLERMTELLAKRAAIARAYQKALCHLWWLEPLARPEGSVWWVYPLLVRKGSGKTRAAVRAHLHQHGIETRSFFKPMHQQPHLKQFATGRYPVADDMYERGFYLPVHFSMTEEDVAYVAERLEEL